MRSMPNRSEVVIRHILERNAAELPNKECILFEDGERWTYLQFLHEAYKAGNVLAGLGVKRGDNVLVFLGNGQGWIRAWTGITALGAVMVPVNIAYKGEFLEFICKDSQAAHIITSPDLAERVKEINLGLNIVDAATLADGSTEPPKLDRPIEPWDNHAIFYTSGTTGQSKGAMHSYLVTLMNPVPWIGCRSTSEDTGMVDFPLFHIAGISVSSGCWALKARLVLRSVFSGNNYLDIIRKCGVTFALMFATIPYFLEAKPAQPDDADNPLRWVNSSPMPRDPEAFKKRFGIEELCTTYGSSETACPIYVKKGDLVKPGSCGRVRDGVEVRLVDENDIPVPQGQPGELIIRTERSWEMFSGYWNLPEETAMAWQNGWYHTGDLMTCDEDGYYYLFDRKKDSIRRRGENISSFEVERQVLSHPDVIEAACVAAPGEFGEDEVKAFLVLQEGAEFDPVNLINFLIPRMPYFMVPHYLECIDALPKTPTMRVKKFELREQGNSSATWDREAVGIKVTRGN